MTIIEILDSKRCYNKETMNNLNPKQYFVICSQMTACNMLKSSKKKFLKAELIHYNYWHNSFILRRRTTLYERQDRT